MTTRPRRYWSLFLAQTLAAVLLFSVGVPFYCHLATRAPGRVSGDTLALAAGCVLVLQAGYWLGHRDFPGPALGGRPLFGHLVVFLGRLAFILASSLFSVVYLVRFDELDPPVGGIVVLPLVLFAIFCFARELERIGNALAGPRRTD
ncbi:MAG: hypothetical protein ABL998_22185 [Planctomycetota bacterium]